MRAVDVPQSALVPRVGDRSWSFHLWQEQLVGWNGYMIRMGHVPFGWLTPDGFPDVKWPWASAAGFLTRWNLALGLAGGGLVREGRSVMAFPEGTRSRDGRVGPFKSGVFVTAIEAGIPVVIGLNQANLEAWLQFTGGDCVLRSGTGSNIA